MKKILLGIITCFVCVGVLVSVAVVSTACKKKKSLVLEPEIMSAEDIEAAKHFTFGLKTYDGVEGYKVVCYKGGIDNNCVIPDTYKGLDVLEIGDSCFDVYRNRENVQSITLPSRLLIIGASAFSSCHGLTEIVIPGSVIEIQRMAFVACSGLITVMINSNSIANQLENLYNSDILSNCTTLYLKEGITATEFVTANYSVETSDKIGYTKYVKN